MQSGRESAARSLELQREDKRVADLIEASNDVIDPIEKEIKAINEEASRIKASPNAQTKTKALDELIKRSKDLIRRVNILLSVRKKELNNVTEISSLAPDVQINLAAAKARILALQDTHLRQLADKLKKLALDETSALTAPQSSKLQVLVGNLEALASTAHRAEKGVVESDELIAAQVKKNEEALAIIQGVNSSVKGIGIIIQTAMEKGTRVNESTTAEELTALVTRMQLAETEVRAHLLEQGRLLGVIDKDGLSTKVIEQLDASIAQVVHAQETNLAELTAKRKGLEKLTRDRTSEDTRVEELIVTLENSVTAIRQKIEAIEPAPTATEEDLIALIEKIQGIEAAALILQEQQSALALENATALPEEMQARLHSVLENAQAIQGTALPEMLRRRKDLEKALSEMHQIKAYESQIQAQVAAIENAKSHIVTMTGDALQSLLRTGQMLAEEATTYFNSLQASPYILGSLTSARESLIKLTGGLHDLETLTAIQLVNDDVKRIAISIQDAMDEAASVSESTTVQELTELAAKLHSVETEAETILSEQVRLLGGIGKTSLSQGVTEQLNTATAQVLTVQETNLAGLTAKREGLERLAQAQTLKDEEMLRSIETFGHGIVEFQHGIDALVSTVATGRQDPSQSKEQLEDLRNNAQASAERKAVALRRQLFYLKGNAPRSISVTAQAKLDAAEHEMLTGITEQQRALTIELENLEQAIVHRQAQAPKRALPEIPKPKKKADVSAEKQEIPETQLHPTFELVLKKDDATGKWSLESKNSASAPSWAKYRDLPDMPKNTTPEELFEALKGLIKMPPDDSDGLVSIESKLSEVPPVIIIHIRAQDPKEALKLAANLIEQASHTLKDKEDAKPKAPDTDDKTGPTI